MTKRRGYTEEEQQSIEKVLDMGFTIENSNGDTARSIYGDIEYVSRIGDVNDYECPIKAINKLFNNH
jgi:hypothetical protein